MEMFIVAFLVIALILLLKQVSSTLRSNEEIEKHALTIEQTQRIYDEEIERREKVLLEVELFLKSATFLKPFAILGGDKIFKYILTEKKLYEFDDFMSEKNQKLKISEEVLYFKKCMYKRVTELNKMEEILDEIKSEKWRSETYQNTFELSLN